VSIELRVRHRFAETSGHNADFIAQLEGRYSAFVEPDQMDMKRAGD
jgi:hypothetical protein